MYEAMIFPDTVEEFMEWFKMVDSKEVYSNGIEYVPIFRMKQWFDHIGEQNKWIPCEERLPDEFQECLVTIYNGDIHCARYSKGFEWDVDEYFCYLHVDDVIAWMPLPEPYKEGER